MVTEEQWGILGVLPAKLKAVQGKYRAEFFPPEAEIEARVEHFIKKDVENEAPVMLVDLGAVVAQMIQWKSMLPDVTPYYAVKCNSNPALMETLEVMGCGFDCASKREFMDLLEMGFSAERIIFANPCKQLTDIKAARAEGLKMCTFDNELELMKLKTHWPEAQLILRIWSCDERSQCRLSNKFGAKIAQCGDLLQRAKELGLRVIGVSFHVGSGCSDALSFAKSLQDAHSVWTEAERQGFKMQILDIGGGFPSQPDVFSDLCKVIRANLTDLFPNAKVIAEPGRFFAASSHTLAVNVFAKRIVGDEHGEEEQQLYVNDGLYQSFNCLLYDHATVQPKPVQITKEAPMRTTIFGPTCDGLDCIAHAIKFPPMQLGEWIYFSDMGAYTIAAASAFNGFYQWRVEYLTSIKF